MKTEQKRKANVKNIIIYSVIGAVAVGAGIGAGLFLHSKLKPDVVVIVGDADAYRPDVDAAMAKYESAKSNGRFLTALTPDELTVVAYKLFAEKETSLAKGVGYTDANTLGLSVHQVILSTIYRVGDQYFEESLSQGMVNLYDRMYEADGNTTMYWTKNGNYADCTPETITNEEYREKMGSNVSTGLRYIVSPQTCLYDSPTASGDPATNAYENDEGKIVVELELNPEISVLDYVRQMKSISDLAAYPIFDYVHLTVTMDKNLNLERMVTHEAYYATTSSGVGSPLEGSITTVYSSDGTETIPSITDVITYPDEL